ncbi:MAG TPA: RluA family pseudouridine synthase [Bacillota bacterium]|nr:RluA family pseudouridine synthase [Bacillota bacterium]
MLNGQSITYLIKTEDQGMTMKSYLRGRHHISRKLLVRMKQEKSIFLNGEFTYLDHPIQPGDVITMVMPVEQSENIIPEPIVFKIVYEDDDLMVINKDSNMCVHPTLLHPSQTLANGVVYYWLQQGLQAKFRPVNRLDKDTSGLLIVAKNQFAHQQLAIVQRKHEIRRTYEAFVHGVVEKGQGMIHAPIGRRDISLVEREVREDGQDAITHYEVLESYSLATYVRLRLETGRTHQIRVHMSWLGHPLVGDDLYGGLREMISRQALHARCLSFPHPRTQEMMKFEAELPEDMQALRTALRQSI